MSTERMIGLVLRDKWRYFLPKLIAYPPFAACHIFTFRNYPLRHSDYPFWDRFLILVFRLVIGVQMIDVLGPEKRRRRTTQEKIAIVQQSFEPGMTVSLVARQHGVAASQLFLWRKQYQEGSLTAVAAGEQVVPASELAAAMKQIKELQRLLGKKTMENELLKEAVEYGRAKKWIAHAPLLPGDGE